MTSPKRRVVKEPSVWAVECLCGAGHAAPYVVPGEIFKRRSDAVSSAEALPMVTEVAEYRRVITKAKKRAYRAKA